MHILIVSSEPYLIPNVPLGGIFQHHQAAALQSVGYKVGVVSGGLLPLRDLLSFRGRPKLEHQGEALVVRKFTKSVLPLRYMPEGYLHRVNIANLVSAIEIYLRESGRPDCIHAHNLQYAGIAGLEIAKKYDIPLVLTEHSSSFVNGGNPLLLHSLFREVVEKCAKNIAVSSSLAGRLNQLFENLQHPFTVVPNVIDLDFASLSSDKDTEQFTFLSIGRLDENKNHELLIRAFAEAFKSLPVLLRIGGNGYEEKRLQALAYSLGVDKQVTFLGFLSRDQVASELGTAHCFVLPSKRETFGVVLIEALSCGVPVVTTPSGGPSDIVDHSNGIMTSDHSVAALVRALQEMRTRYPEFDRTKIRADALNRFSPQSFCSEMTAIYQGAALA